MDRGAVRLLLRSGEVPGAECGANATEIDEPFLPLLLPQ